MPWLGEIAQTCVPAMKEKIEATEEGPTRDLIFKNELN